MKKKILFLCSNMDVGGFQKSLVSLLRCFDYEAYDVDLLLLNPTGIFMDLIPEQVNILTTVIEPEYFSHGQKAVLSMLKKGKLYEAFIRLISCLLWTFDKSKGAAFMIKAVAGPVQTYDAAIDYNGQHLLYYMVEKVRCENKISYFHTDYIKWPFYVVGDRKYYGQVSSIVTVSEECVASMRKVFPEYADKIHCIENINSEKTVNLFPMNSNSFQDEFDGIRLVTVGRVCKDKGIDFVLEALHKLLDDGYNVRWYMVGPLTDKKFYQKSIEKYGECTELILLGATNNPYDYMRNADIIVHPSRFEGKAVAVEEAKILRKPIIATNFSTVKNQIIDGETGVIVEMNGNAVYEGVKRLLDDQVLMSHIVARQEELCHGNESEVRKLYKLIER
jgi:glycosyltransferase involved in cell wall biosynthesis